MTTVSKRDVLWWHAVGMCCGVLAATCVGLTGITGNPDTSYWVSVRETIAMITMIVITATPLTLPALLLWTRLARTYSGIERSGATRIIGLTTISFVCSTA